jgi:hypothetical protein
VVTNFIIVTVVAGYAPTAPLLGVPDGPSRRGAGGTQAGGDHHQGQCVVGARPGAYRAMRVGCHSAGSNSRYGNETALYGSVAEEGPDQGDPSLEAGVQLAERGARRAVMDFWGRLHGFAQLGVPKARMGLGGSLPPYSQGNGNGSEMRGAVV